MPVAAIAGLASSFLQSKGSGGGSSAPGSAVTQTFNNKAKGPKVTTKIQIGDTNSGGAAPAGTTGTGELFARGGIEPWMLTAAMIFTLVLVAIVALLGR